MEIKRNGEVYVLTSDELYMAFGEQQTLFQEAFMQAFLAEKLGRELRQDSAEDRALFSDVMYYFEKYCDCHGEDEMLDAEMAYDRCLQERRAKVNDLV